MRLLLTCLIALLVAGCASTNPGGPGRAPTGSPSTGSPSTMPPTGSRSTSTSPSTGGPPTPPASTPPGGTPIRLFANTQALSFSAEPGVVLRSPAEVTRFVHWLRTRPRRADADGPVATAVSHGLAQAPALVVIAQNVGCSTMKQVTLGTRGSNLILVPSGVRTYPECYRANVAVAVFAVPSPLPASGLTLNGQAPNTDWR